MDRKGFTLIELIAVIVILSLIAMVVFPAINSVIKNSKEKAFDQQKATIIKAAKQLSYEKSFVLPEDIDGASSEIDIICLTSGCTIDGKTIDGGYINEEDIKDPRKTTESLNGVIRITYGLNQYNYEFIESDSGVAKATTGNWLLKNASNRSILKAADNTYKGNSTNNYINFSGSTWRILNINSDRTITIVKNTPVVKLSFDNGGVNDFEKSSINNYLNNTYYNSLSQRDYIKPTSKCIGPGDNACDKKYTSNVGLLTTDEYVQASSDEGCSISNFASCSNGNFLSEFDSLFTMNYSGNGVVAIDNGTFVTVNPNMVLNVVPVVTLKDSVKITGGSGSNDNPYLIG